LSQVNPEYEAGGQTGNNVFKLKVREDMGPENIHGKHKKGTETF
jgi:hypothetical protein